MAGTYQGTDGKYYAFLASAANPQQAVSLKVPGQTATSNIYAVAVRGNAVTGAYGTFGSTAFYATTAGGSQDIAPLAGGSNVRPLGFDAAGNVVGVYSTKGGERSFVYDPATGTSAPFIYAGATPAGTTVSVTDVTSIDQAGDVFGTYTDSSGARHGFVEQNGAFQTVPAPDGTTATAPNGADSAGDVVGIYSPDNSDLSTSSGYVYDIGFVDRLGVSAPLASPGQPIPRTSGLYVDARGQIVSAVRDGTVTHAFLAAPGSVSIFDGRPDAVDTKPVGSDAAGDVAGYDFDANGVEHGFLRRADGTVVAFDASATATTTSVVDIDAAGEIFGNDKDGGQTHAFLRAVDGTITRLDPAGDTSATLDVADANGDAAGDYQTVANGTTTDVGIFRRVNGTVTATSLAGLGAVEIDSTFLDAAGDAYGIYRTAGNNRRVYFVSVNGAAARIDLPSSKAVTNVVGNRAGTVAGTYDDAGGTSHGFIVANGQTTLVDVPAGSTPTPVGDVSVVGIDAAGDVAGTYTYNGGKSANAYVRTAGGTFSTLALPSDAVVGGTPKVVGITGSGVVVGQYVGKDTQTHLFVAPSGATAATRLDPQGSTGAFFVSGQFDQGNGAAGPPDGVIAANYTDASGVKHGLLDIDGQVSTVNGSAAATETTIRSVDSQGNITGYYRDGAGYHVFESFAARTPTISGTHASGTTGEAVLSPFAGVTVGDGNAGASETLTITLSGSGGALGDGAGYAALKLNADGTYTLTGSTATVTSELDALRFTPASAGSTTFKLTDVTSAGGVFTNTASDGATVVTDTPAPPAPTPTPTPTPSPTPSPTPTPTPAPIPVVPDTVALSTQVSYDRGVFTLSGTAVSAVGVRSVEISAQVDGVQTDLGAATVSADGTFTFSDRIGKHTQSFVTATGTDGAGVVTSAQAAYSLTGGVGGTYKAEQDLYSADGSAVTATDLFKAGGAQKATLDVGGLTFYSANRDLFENGGQPGSTFVFNPGYGHDVIDLLRPDGADHDTLSFLGSDFDNDVATVLAHTFNDEAGDAVIYDPAVKGDSVTLIGVSKQQFAAFAQQDITFHA